VAAASYEARRFGVHTAWRFREHCLRWTHWRLWRSWRQAPDGGCLGNAVLRQTCRG
jgi:hypothetical protein